MNTGRTCSIAKQGVAIIASIAVALQPMFAYANPLGGVVSAGQATITQSGNTLDVNQTSNKAVIDWRGFDIAPGETTQFFQPSAGAIALNRVNSSSASNIQGTLLANGNIIIINQNGVVFGAGATVDVNGLIATTANISNNAFMNAAGSTFTFDQPGNPGASIINNGTITAAQGGLVGLVAPNVINNGVITAKLGTVQLASGDTATIDMYGDNLMSVAVSDQIKSQLVANNGLIEADGGKVALTAAAGSNIINSLITVPGEIKTPAVSQQDGKILIYAEGSNAVVNNVAANKGQVQGSSTVQVSGTLDASGTGSGQTGGNITITGDHVGIMSGASINASGDAGGGTIQIGGDFHGQGATRRALYTYVDANTQINANATVSGNGGQVVVWSDINTVYDGNITAMGGPGGGNGGYVETSGKQILTMDGYVNASAPHGASGMWLMDPNNAVINATDSNESGDPSFVFSATGSVNASHIDTDLGLGTSVTVTASGTITVSAAISPSANYNGTVSIALNAGQGITFTASDGISNGTATNTHINVDINADTAAGGGSILFNTGSYITTNGGYINIGGGGSGDTNATVGDSTTKIGVEINGATLNTTGTAGTSGQNISIMGTGYAGTTNDYGVEILGASSISSGADSITISGTGAGSSTGGRGVYITGTDTLTISSTTGAISITGVGASGGTGTDYGVNIKGTGNGTTYNPLISSTGTGGTITITGTAGTGTTYGVYMSDTTDGTGAGVGEVIEGGDAVKLRSNEDILLTNADIYYASGTTPAVTLDTSYSTVGAITAGAILVTTSNITTNGGTIVMGGGTAPGTYGAVGNATNVAGININGGTINAGSGSITMTGTGYTAASGNSSSNYGVEVQSGTIETTGSNGITIAGTGGGHGTGSANIGVVMTGGTIEVAGGALTITGTGGSGSTGGGNDGIYANTTSTIETTGTGNILLLGTGGSNSSDSTGGDVGIIIGCGSGCTSSTVESTSTASTAGTITLIGYGGDYGGSGPGSTGNSQNGPGSYGVWITSGTVTSADGAILIDGNSVAGQSAVSAPVSVTNATGGFSFGVVIDQGSGGSGGTGGIVSSTGSGSSAATITINGVGGTKGGYNDGVQMGNEVGGTSYGSGSMISTVDGNITITGTAGGTSGGNNVGILTDNVGYYGGNIETTGKGNILLTGTGGGNSSDTNGNDYGIYSGGDTISSTLSGSTAGTITMIGYGGDTGGSGSSNYGVYIGGTVTSVSGASTIDGNTGTTTGQTVTTSTGSSNDGIYLGAGITSTGTANITLDSVGENSAKSFDDSGHNTVGGASDTGNITMIQDTATWGGGAAGTDIVLKTTTSGTVQIESYSTGSGNTVGVAGGAGNLNVDSTFLGNISAPNIIIGRTDTAGQLTANTYTTWASNVSLETGTGTLDITAAQTMTTHNLTLQTDGTLTIAGNLTSTGTGTLTIEPSTVSDTIGVNATSGSTLLVTPTDLTHINSQG